MTKPKPLPEIAAGGRIRTIWGTNSYYVENKAGWFGPTRITKRGAILAWNRVMTTPWLLKKVRENICDRIEEKLRDAISVFGKLDAAIAELKKIRRGK